MTELHEQCVLERQGEDGGARPRWTVTFSPTLEGREGNPSDEPPIKESSHGECMQVSEANKSENNLPNGSEFKMKNCREIWKDSKENTYGISQKTRSSTWKNQSAGEMGQADPPEASFTGHRRCNVGWTNSRSWIWKNGRWCNIIQVLRGLWIIYIRKNPCMSESFCIKMHLSFNCNFSIDQHNLLVD